MAEGGKTSEARLEAKGLQDPDQDLGISEPSLAAFSGYLPHCFEKWKLRSLDIGNAFVQADGFTRNVISHAPSNGAHPTHADFGN